MYAIKEDEAVFQGKRNLADVLWEVEVCFVNDGGKRMWRLI